LQGNNIGYQENGRDGLPEVQAERTSEFAGGICSESVGMAARKPASDTLCRLWGKGMSRNFFWYSNKEWERFWEFVFPYRASDLLSVMILIWAGVQIMGLCNELANEIIAEG
jgi:hypothetical protein